MNIANIVVNQTTGFCAARMRIPAGVVGATVTVTFADPLWDRLEKRVVFRGGDLVKIADRFDGTTAVIPAEVIAEPGTALYFGIWGHDPDGILQLPLIEVRLGQTERASEPGADPDADPDLPIWAQLQKELDDLKNNGIPGGIPDWNAAEGEPGHVLNRTHWAEGGLVELLPETTLTTDDEGFADIAADFTLIAGDVYTVVYNGTAYQCTCVESDGARILANDGINVDTGEGMEFAIVQYTGSTFILSMTPGEVTLSIYHGGEIVHKLNNKYLDLDWLPVLEYDDIIPKTTVTPYMHIPGTGGIYSILEVGQTFILIVDDVEYKTTVTVDLDGKYLEDYGTERDPSNAQPPTLINGKWGFRVAYSSARAYFWGTEPGTHTIRLVSAAGNKNRIPESFIPDGYAKQEDIPTDKHIIDLIEEHATDSGGNVDVTIDGETLVIAENSTATIENETLIL